MTNTLPDRANTIKWFLILGSALPLIGEPGIAVGFVLLIFINSILWIPFAIEISNKLLWRLIAIVAMIVNCAFVYGAFFSSWYAGR